MTLQSEWESYRIAVMPEDAEAVQLQDSRRAFHAGVAAILKVVANAIDNDNDPLMALLLVVQQECLAFVAEDVKIWKR